MWSYITDELPAPLPGQFPVGMSRQGITGIRWAAMAHSPLGSLPERYRSVSALAPSRMPWGEKALGCYQDDDRAAWRRRDAVALIEDGARVAELLVDQGDADPFLVEQLQPEHLCTACDVGGDRPDAVPPSRL